MELLLELELKHERKKDRQRERRVFCLVISRLSQLLKVISLLKATNVPSRVASTFTHLLAVSSAKCLPASFSMNRLSEGPALSISRMPTSPNYLRSPELPFRVPFGSGRLRHAAAALIEFHFPAVGTERLQR